MITVILVIHLLIAIAMVALILLQRSEGGALGIGGGGGGGGGGAGLMTGRAAGNLLTRGTGILAACFMATSLTLAILADGGARTSSVLDAVPADTGTSAPAQDSAPAPEGTGSEPVPAVPAVPQVPSAPLSE